MSEFDKFWRDNQESLRCNVEEARRIWDAAQMRAIRTLHNPPVVPKAGQYVKLLNMCHPSLLGKTRKVIEIVKVPIEVYNLQIEHGDVISMGLLGEVEIVR